MTNWLPSARKHDLHPGIGNGPFRDFRGVVLHVNVDRYGTPASFWGNGNPGQVCPNFQVFKDGSIDQMLPLDWQPWCQKDGNFQYAAIETAGMPDEPLTAAQMKSCAAIVRAYHEHLGMKLAIADKPGERGLITHQAGGQAWGGHSCPGTIRAAQRDEILRLAGRRPSPTPAAIDKPTDPIEEIPDMTPQQRQDLIDDIATAVWRRKLTKDRTAAQLLSYSHGRLIRIATSLRSRKAK